MAQKKSIDDQTVLEMALLVISERGPETFTLAQVGQAVGLAPATLMQRFGSKQGLLIGAAKQAAVQLQREIAQLQEQQLPWDRELIRLLGALPEGFGSRQEIANSLGLLKLDMVDPELHPLARQLFALLRQRIEQLLRQGQALEQLDPTIDVAAIARELEALRHGLVIQWCLGGDGPLHQWLEGAFDNYFRRIKR